MAEFQLAGLLADLVHGEVDDPAKFVPLGVHVTRHGRTELRAQHARRLLRGGLFAGRHADEAAGLEAEGSGDLRRLVREELCDAAGEIALLVDLEPVGLAAGLHLDIGAELVDGLARKRARGHDDGLDGVACGKGRKVAAGDERRHVLYGQVDAQVWLIRAVGVHRVAVGNAAEGRLGCNAVLAVLGKDRREHVLEHREHVVLRGKGHLHVELIEFAGAAVAAGVLVAEARGDLEIAVEARRHEQLLELLRRLRQSVKLAGVLARRHKIVARALGAGRREDGRGDLEKAVRGHGGAQRGHHLAAQDDVLLYGGVAQVEIAVLQAQRLIGVAAAVDLKRQLVIAAAAEHLDLRGHDLNVAGGQLGVFARALAHDALDGDRGLLVERLDDLHHVLGLNDDLRRAVKITDDDEGKILSDLADVFHPADDADLLADVFEPQLVASVCAGLKHTPDSLSFYRISPPAVRRRIDRITARAKSRRRCGARSPRGWSRARRPASRPPARRCPCS